MPHTAAFYDWEARVNALRVALKPHHRAALAEYSFGRALARCGGRTSVAASLAVKAGTLPQRLRELYPPASAQIGAARSEFDYTLCCAPLVRWAAAGHPDKRLVLALDPTGRTDRFRVPCAAVLYRGCGLPVAGAVQAADEKGSWDAIWFDLLGKSEAARGDGRTVPVLTDRGPESPALFRARVRLGWHPLVRVKGRATFRPAGGHSGYRADHFAAQVGGVWSGEGVAYPAGDRRGCTLLASWGAGHDEPWLLLTDLPVTGGNAAWYAWRMWIEQGFRALKRGCGQWQRAQMSEPVRVARLWAVIAAATMYAVEVGGEAEPAGVPPAGGPWSRLKRGLLRIWVALLSHASMPGGRIAHHDWPKPGDTCDSLVEPYVHRG